MNNLAGAGPDHSGSDLSLAEPVMRWGHTAMYDGSPVDVVRRPKNFGISGEVCMNRIRYVFFCCFLVFFSGLIWCFSIVFGFFVGKCWQSGLKKGFIVALQGLDSGFGVFVVSL